MAKDSAWLRQLGGGWCGFGELCRYLVAASLMLIVVALPLGLTVPPPTARRRRRGDRLVTGDVRLWPKADIGECTAQSCRVRHVTRRVKTLKRRWLARYVDPRT